jgi:septal ring factor EnvC (AmiA/AmiB activator)
LTKHISGQRKEKVQASIEWKINILEGYLVNGVPTNAFVPKNMTQFRLWEDAAANVARIGSPNTMDAIHNSGLKLRIGELLKELISKKNRRQSRSNEVSILRRELREMSRLIQDLTDQLHATRHECDRANQSERRLLNRVSELQRDNGDLARKLAALVPLRTA